ncbi:MAG: hypothetical protein Q4C36_04120 [Coriobacteriia bacterium]|nr:hypothetical protein [Coriobacteriia bacterium]
MNGISRHFVGDGLALLRAVVALTLVCCLAGLATLAAPDSAHAVTRAEQKAFDRSVKAIKDYKNQPTDIVVDVSDLSLTRSQMYRVYERVRWDGHYFWINPFGEKSAVIDGTKTITYHCAYSDATITAMRKKFNAKVKAALKWAPVGMTKVERIHMLHDWFMTRGAVWTDSLQSDGSRNIDYKLAYGALVLKKGDCMSFALAMRVLLDEAGFTTDYAYITGEHSHSWTRVKLGGVWYNIDAAWDNTYTRNYPSYWDDGICHMYLMVNDWVMENGSPDNFNDYGHPGFVANNKNTAKSYAKRYLDFDWAKTTRKWMKVGSTFKCGQFTYTVLRNHKVKAVKCNAKSKATLVVPRAAAYRGHSYKITGFGTYALSGTKAKILVVKSPHLMKSGLKNSLRYTKVAKVKVAKSRVGKATYNKYRTYFKKANSGKRVRLSYA